MSGVDGWGVGSSVHWMMIELLILSSYKTEIYLHLQSSLNTLLKVYSEGGKEAYAAW